MEPTAEGMIATTEMHHNQVPQSSEPPDARHSGLSAIAEDTEVSPNSEGAQDDASAIARISHLESIPAKKQNGGKPKKKVFEIDMANVMDIDDVTQVMPVNVSSSTSGNSFHTIPLDSPVAPKKLEAPVNEVPLHAPMEITPVELNDGTQATVDVDSNITPPISPEELLTSPADGPHFPMLSQPSPLRKSMRHPKEAQHIGGVSRSSTVTGHSSWLVKTREKATDDTTKRLPVQEAVHPPPSAAGNKRKSGDLHDTAQGQLGSTEDKGRSRKMSKITEPSPALNLLRDHERLFFDRFHEEMTPLAGDEEETKGDGSGGMIEKLKEQVAGYSTRAGKSMGKSLGGAAAAALAEARAAAEAKIAERNAAEGRNAFAPSATSTPEVQTQSQDPPPFKPPVPVFTAPTAAQRDQASKSHASDKDRRLSVSELVTKEEGKSSSKGMHPVFQRPPAQGKEKSPKVQEAVAADTSTSTTPPHSPPKARPPVFTLPAKASKPTAPESNPQPSQEFSQVENAPRGLQPIATTQSTVFSTQSTFCDPLFDSQVPPWVPSTQGTDFEDQIGFRRDSGQDLGRSTAGCETDMDADESWHLDEKFVTWTPVGVGMKDDSMTWSTAPTRSTRNGETDGLASSIPASRARVPSIGEQVDRHSSRSRPQSAYSSEKDVYESAPDGEDMDVDVEDNVPSIRLVTPAAQKTNRIPFVSFLSSISYISVVSIGLTNCRLDRTTIRTRAASSAQLPNSCPASLEVRRARNL
jgi:hypothetical protein